MRLHYSLLPIETMEMPGKQLSLEKQGSFPVAVNQALTTKHPTTIPLCCKQTDSRDISKQEGIRHNV